jgi:hypothetical protein
MCIRSHHVPCHPRILSHHRSRRMWRQVTPLWTILSTLMSKLTTFMETSLRSARNSEHAVRTTSLADKAWSRTTFSRCAEQPENMWNFVSTSSWPRIVVQSYLGHKEMLRPVIDRTLVPASQRNMAVNVTCLHQCQHISLPVEGAKCQGALGTFHRYTDSKFKMSSGCP